VRRAVAEPLEEDERRRERAALDRLGEGLGGANRAEAGLDAVLGALNERRVGVLLYEDGFAAPGVSCPSCGWLGVDTPSCPLDGTATDRRDNIVEEAVEAAVLQAAEPVAVRHHDDLRPHGSIAAMLRF
jgi:peptide chain release factor subunit 1